jgi:hypothetical protein
MRRFAAARELQVWPVFDVVRVPERMGIAVSPPGAAGRCWIAVDHVFG